MALDQDGAVHPGGVQIAEEDLDGDGILVVPGVDAGAGGQRVAVTVGRGDMDVGIDDGGHDRAAAERTPRSARRRPGGTGRDRPQSRRGDG